MVLRKLTYQKRWLDFQGRVITPLSAIKKGHLVVQGICWGLNPTQLFGDYYGASIPVSYFEVGVVSETEVQVPEIQKCLEKKFRLRQVAVQNAS